MEEDYKYCEECGKSQGIEGHHIVFKSQLGLDFALNFKYLCAEHHKGNEGPHRNREKDLEYKQSLQAKLKNILCNNYYTEIEVVKILGLDRTQAKKMFRKIPVFEERYRTEDIIYRLMGRRNYED